MRIRIPRAALSKFPVELSRFSATFLDDCSNWSTFEVPFPVGFSPDWAFLATVVSCSLFQIFYLIMLAIFSGLCNLVLDLLLLVCSRFFKQFLKFELNLWHPNSLSLHLLCNSLISYRMFWAFPLSSPEFVYVVLSAGSTAVTHGDRLMPKANSYKTSWLDVLHCHTHSCFSIQFFSIWCPLLHIVPVDAQGHPRLCTLKLICRQILLKVLVCYWSLPLEQSDEWLGIYGHGTDVVVYSCASHGWGVSIAPTLLPRRRIFFLAGLTSIAVCQ